MFINQKIIRLLIFAFCFNIFSSIAQTKEGVPLNNIILYENPRPISPVIFKDFSSNKINLTDYHGKLLIVNFWATWGAPCKKEMPSLDNLYQNSKFKNLEIIAVNMEAPNNKKTKNFLMI